MGSARTASRNGGLGQALLGDQAKPAADPLWQASVLAMRRMGL